MVSRGWSQPDPGSTGAAFHRRDNGRSKVRERRRRRLRGRRNGLSRRSPRSVTGPEHPAPRRDGGCADRGAATVGGVLFDRQLRQSSRFCAPGAGGMRYPLCEPFVTESHCWLSRPGSAPRTHFASRGAPNASHGPTVWVLEPSAYLTVFRRSCAGEDTMAKARLGQAAVVALALIVWACSTAGGSPPTSGVAPSAAGPSAAASAEPSSSAEASTGSGSQAPM